MLDGAIAFCADMADGKEPRWLSLLGPSGSGKTFLTTLIHEWVKKNFYVNSGAGPMGTDLYRSIMFVDSYRWVKMDAAENWNYTPRICTAFFACIDDLAAPRDNTGHLANCYSDVSQQRGGKWTIITSNLLSDDIRENVDTRVASRLYRHGSVVIETNAGDWNLR